MRIHTLYTHSYNSCVRHGFKKSERFVVDEVYPAGRVGKPKHPASPITDDGDKDETRTIPKTARALFLDDSDSVKGASGAYPVLR